MALDQLSRTLKTAHNAQVVKIKLAKKQGAFLMVEVIQVSVLLERSIYLLLEFSGVCSIRVVNVFLIVEKPLTAYNRVYDL